MDLNNKKCKSVREFFDYLIASGQLLESQKSYDEKSRTKLINGRVTADGRNVVAGLDWSHVRARQFRFNNDTAAEPLISSYDKLPVTTHGISGDLPMPENIVQFLSHNACGHFHAEQERIVIEKNITIVPMKDMDLSRVEVQGSVMWHGGKIRLSQLPKVSGKIYGLKREDIITEKEAKLNAATMKRLHVQPSVFLDRKPKGFIREIFGRYFNCA